MFSLSATESGLHFMPVLDVPMFKEVFSKISKKMASWLNFKLNLLMYSVHY